MARRRKDTKKPHLLAEATVKKFMKLSGLENHSNNFRKEMGYNTNERERYWEQPGLSQYRSRLHEEMEGNVSQDPDKAIGPGAQDQLSEEEEMELGGAEVMGAEEAPAEEPAPAAEPAGDVEAKVEDIVTAIADAIEQAVPEVSVDVEGGADAAPAPAAEEPAAPVDAAPAEEPAPEEEALQETIRKAIREAFRMREEMEGNVSQDPDKAIGPGAQDQLSEEEEVAANGNGGDAPEVEAVVDAIVDAIEASTDMEVQAEPAPENGNGAAEEAPEDEEAAAMDKMMEALSNRKTAKRLVERVMKRARAQARSNSQRPRRRRRR
tara:strand:+ start:4474 stop:5439 length:966 start_codon:yes stop_codon:yes gene_type:complete